MLVRLLRTLHRWAESGWARGATTTWEFLQSSVVPGPSGAIFAPLAVADPPRAPMLAAWAAAGAITGGVLAYLIGSEAFEAVGRQVLGFVGVSDKTLLASEAMFARHGWKIVFLSTISPLSTKLTCIAAGAFGIPFVQFVPALAVGRVIRFAALTVILRFAGTRLQARLARRRGSRADAEVVPGDA